MELLPFHLRIPGQEIPPAVEDKFLQSQADETLKLAELRLNAKTDLSYSQFHRLLDFKVAWDKSDRQS